MIDIVGSLIWLGVIAIVFGLARREPTDSSKIEKMDRWINDPVAGKYIRKIRRNMEKDAKMKTRKIECGMCELLKLSYSTLQIKYKPKTYPEYVGDVTDVKYCPRCGKRLEITNNKGGLRDERI